MFARCGESESVHQEAAGPAAPVAQSGHAQLAGLQARHQLPRHPRSRHSERVAQCYRPTVDVHPEIRDIEMVTTAYDAER